MKIKTPLIFGTGVWVGLQIGRMREAMHWAEANPDHPDAQKINSSRQKARDSVEELQEAIKNSWETAGFNRTFEEMMDRANEAAETVRDKAAEIKDDITTPLEQEPDEVLAQVPKFVRDFGDDIELARRMAADPYKAPEQKHEAQEFIDWYEASQPEDTRSGGVTFDEEPTGNRPIDPTES